MNLSKRVRLLIISSVYVFAFWSIPAESGWLNTARETAERFESGYITFQDPVVSQNIQLAQAKTAAERKQEAENAEQAALKKLEELKKKIAQRKQAKEAKKQAEIEEAQEDKLKEEARLEQERKFKIKEEARLKAEKKARQEQQARQEKQRLAQFLKSKDIAGHPCSEYDVNNEKQARACLQSLESNGVKYGIYLPKFWLAKGTCQDMQDAIGENLQVMGFWKSAIDKRVPNCKMLAALHEEKFKDDVYWSKCVDGPKNDAQYVFDCLNFGKTIFLHESPNRYPQVYRNNLRSAGFDVGVEVEHRYQRDFWKPVFMLVLQERGKSQARMVDRIQDSLYEIYYTETPERKKSKYSDAERKMMKDGKLKVPSSYAAPTADEIRLAVMRSIVNRANGGEGNDPDNSYIRALKRQKKPVVAVVTDGDTIYLPKGMPASVGMQIDFRDVQNARCRKRSGGQGYMCQYRLNTQADFDRYSNAKMGSQDIFSIPANTIAKMSVQLMSRVENYTNWFILTEKGWRQPHTSQEMSEIQDHERSTTQSIQQQNNRPREEDATMLDDAMQGLQSGFRAQGAGAALELKRLW